MPLRSGQAADDTSLASAEVVGPTPSSGSTSTGNLTAPTDPTTGSDGSGTGALAPQYEPAIAIGLDLARRGAKEDDAGQPVAEDTPHRSLLAMSLDRRKRSLYSERKPPSPPTSGINL